MKRLSIFLFGSIVLVSGCKKSDTSPDYTNNMAGIRRWYHSSYESERTENPSGNFVTIFDSTYHYPDVNYAVQLVDHRTIIFFGTRLNVDNIDSARHTITFEEHGVPTSVVSFTYNYATNAMAYTRREDGTHVSSGETYYTY